MNVFAPIVTTPVCTAPCIHRPLPENSLSLSFFRGLQAARYAVDLCPAQAGAWINLARVYVACRNYGMALVALNVTPMSHGHEFVVPEMPEPLRMVGINEVIRGKDGRRCMPLF